MKFKVGQRVRVVWSESRHFLKTGTVCKCDIKPVWSSLARLNGVVPGEPAYRVEIDKVGKHDGSGIPFAFVANDLAPLTDPGFESFMERIQKPLTKPEWEAA